LVAVAVGAASCSYSTTFSDCTVLCGAAGECPGGFVCGDEGYCRVEGATPSCGALRDGGTDVDAPPAVACMSAGVQTDLDILFVIDDSGSMAEEQTTLAAAFGGFESALAARFAALPNLHIGVVSSNMGAGGFSITGCLDAGDDGRLHGEAQGACTPPTEAFLSDVDVGGARQRNYTGTLAEAFSCIALLGTNGCGFEQHLASMKRALDGSQPANAGFLRPGAFLAVIILADEDDCSASDGAVFDTSETTLGPLSSFRCAEYGVRCDGGNLTRAPASYASCTPRTDSYLADPADYAAFLRGLKADPCDVLVATIVAPPSPFTVSLDQDAEPTLDPSCMSVNGSGFPAVRLNDFAARFPDRSFASGICDLDYGLDEIAQAIGDAMGAP
jgi:hypothetical protein